VLWGLPNSTKELKEQKKFNNGFGFNATFFLFLSLQMSYNNITGAEYNATQLRLDPNYIW
jgi:hypothetical protein